jgi:hypothetical protein
MLRRISAVRRLPLALRSLSRRATASCPASAGSGACGVLGLAMSPGGGVTGGQWGRGRRAGVGAAAGRGGLWGRWRQQDAGALPRGGAHRCGWRRRGRTPRCRAGCWRRGGWRRAPTRTRPRRRRRGPGPRRRGCRPWGPAPGRDGGRAGWGGARTVVLARRSSLQGAKLTGSSRRQRVWGPGGGRAPRPCSWWGCRPCCSAQWAAQGWAPAGLDGG